jgi:hypothetical protein
MRIVADLIAEAIERLELPAELFDLSAATAPAAGLALPATGPQTAAEELGQVCDALGIDLVAREGKLVAVPRPAAPEEAPRHEEAADE